MKYFIQAKPRAKQNRIEAIDETHFRIWVKSLPRDGEANAAVVELLASFLGKPKSNFQLLSGHRSKNKVVGLK